MPDKILVVDDDVETLRLVGLMLQRQGFEIVVANSGAKALSQAAREHPDLILLDVMLPDVDGYEVTRELRKDPQIGTTPILMFTARTQLDAKMQGYEAGVDDYLTKPVHPVELVARIKALLARNRGRVPGVVAAERGYLLGVVAPKGGLGVSSLVLNLAINLYQKHKLELIAAELRPGNGTWGGELGFTNPTGLNNLLRLKPPEINAETVAKELSRTNYGVRLLLASHSLSDLSLLTAGPQFEAIVQQLSTLAPMCLLDIGSPLLPGFDRICPHLQELILVTEPYPATVVRTRNFMDELNERGFGRGRLLTVVMINRVRADIQLSISQVQERLGVPVQVFFPPAPEQAYQAGLRNLPLTEVQPESLLSQQFNILAGLILQRVRQ
jgi:DNA-binding response OmpR family regulator